MELAHLHGKPTVHGPQTHTTAVAPLLEALDPALPLGTQEPGPPTVEASAPVPVPATATSTPSHLARALPPGAGPGPELQLLAAERLPGPPVTTQKLTMRRSPERHTRHPRQAHTGALQHPVFQQLPPALGPIAPQHQGPTTRLRRLALAMQVNRLMHRRRQWVAGLLLRRAPGHTMVMQKMAVRGMRKARLVHKIRQP